MLAFIHIHKAAGTTVHHILRSSFGFRHCDVRPWNSPPPGLEQWQVPFTAEDLQRLYVIYPNLRSIASHSVHPYSDLDSARPDIIYFTLMRDPLKMGASLYQYVVENNDRRGLTFESWIAKETTRNRQTKIIAGRDDVNAAIQVISEKNVFVGLSERFDESMLLLKSFLAPDVNIGYERKNVAHRNVLAEQILTCDDTRQMLIEANQADIELYKFVCREIYPVYQQEYGKHLERDVANYKCSRGGFNKRNEVFAYLKHHALYRSFRFLYQMSTQTRLR